MSTTGHYLNSCTPASWRAKKDKEKKKVAAWRHSVCLRQSLVAQSGFVKSTRLLRLGVDV